MKFVGYERKRKGSENRTHMGEVEEILLSRGGGGEPEKGRTTPRSTTANIRRVPQNGAATKSSGVCTCITV